MVDGGGDFVAIAMGSDGYRFLDGQAQDRLEFIVPPLDEGGMECGHHPGVIFIRPEGIVLALINAPSSQESLQGDVSQGDDGLRLPLVDGLIQMWTASINGFVFVAGILQLVPWWTTEEDVCNPEVVPFCLDVSFQNLTEEESSGTDEGFSGACFVEAQRFTYKHHPIGSLSIDSEEAST